MSTLSGMGKEQIEFLLKDNNDAAVAKQFGVTSQAIYHIRKKFGIPPSRRVVKKTNILDLKKQGASVAKIATIVRMSQSYVYKTLRGDCGKSRTEPSVKDPS